MRPKHDAMRGLLLSVIAALCLLIILFGNDAQARPRASLPQSCPVDRPWHEPAAKDLPAAPHFQLDARAHAARCPP